MKPHVKLYAVFAAFLINLILVPVLGIYANSLVGYSIFTLFVVLLPLYVLSSKDALEYIGHATELSATQRLVAWLVACIPVLTFGLLATGIGAAIIFWVLYNFLVERQPEFTGPAMFGGFGIGPALVVFGLYTLRSLWVKQKNA